MPENPYQSPEAEEKRREPWTREHLLNILAVALVWAVVLGLFVAVGLPVGRR